MRPLLSICMMVKDEEKNLERCLQSLQLLMKSVPSELIIVDTGSTDDTVNIARRFTDKVYFHLWNNNFSEMRNITISYARGQWVFIFDADEEMENADSLIKFLKGHPNSRIGSVALMGKSFTGARGQCVSVVTPRIFRHNNYFYYQGVVHNEAVFRGAVKIIDSSFFHYGYLSTDKTLMEQKFQRTSALLKSELEKDPENIYYRYQLSVSYSMHGDWPEALQELQKIYERYKDEDDDFWRKNLYIIGGLLQVCAGNQCSDNKYVQFGLRGIKLEPEYVDLYFFLAQILEIQGNSKEAYEYYAEHEKLVKKFSELNFSHNMSLQHYTLSFLSIDYFNMGVICLHKGDYVRSRQHLQQMLAIVVEDDPNISQAYVALMELDFKEKDFAASRKIYGTLVEKKSDLELSNMELKMEKSWKNMQGEERQRFCQQFQDLPNLYGKLNCLRLHTGAIGGAEWQSLIAAVTSTDMNILSDYYAPILAYRMKYFPQEVWQLSACLSEKTIVEYMSYLDEVDKVMFVDICRGYIALKAVNMVNPYQTIRLQKNIAKYLLFSGELNDIDYLTAFKSYINWGQSYMELLYKEIIFENELKYDIKNKEEEFLLYITLANRSSDHKTYLHYLNRALKSFPEMNKGINELVQSFQKQVTRVSDEMNDLKFQLHNQIQTLIDAGEGILAKNVIDEYEQICGSDVESLMFKSQAMLLIH